MEKAFVDRRPDFFVEGGGERGGVFGDVADVFDGAEVDG